MKEMHVPKTAANRSIRATRRGHMTPAFAGLALALTLAACGGAASAPPGTAGPTGAPASGTPLLGAWVTEISKADFTAAGLTDPGMQNENSGRFTWTFGADGTWTQVQESLDGSPIMTPIFKGTYTVEGDALLVTTTFPEQYADDGLRYTWALAGDALTLQLHNPPDPLLPVVVESHPWSRVP
jgi:hypothetical protein